VTGWEWENADSRIDRPEVALDTADLLFEDLMPETSLELTLAQRGRCHTHGFLSTAQQNLEIE
jgi:hypothetical protein